MPVLQEACRDEGAAEGLPLGHRQRIVRDGFDERINARRGIGVPSGRGPRHTEEAWRADRPRQPRHRLLPLQLWEGGVRARGAAPSGAKTRRSRRLGRSSKSDSDAQETSRRPEAPLDNSGQFGPRVDHVQLKGSTAAAPGSPTRRFEAREPEANSWRVDAHDDAPAIRPGPQGAVSRAVPRCRRGKEGMTAAISARDSGRRCDSLFHRATPENPPGVSFWLVRPRGYPCLIAKA